MRARPGRRGSRALRSAVDGAISAVTVLSLAGGGWLLATGARGHAPPQPTAAQAATAPPGGRGAAPLPVSAPRRIRIPSLKVDAPLMPLGLTPQGSLDVPPANAPRVAGWYAAGTAPGSVGTALVAGHVDTAGGPAVFYGLGALRRGSPVEVVRADGSTARFTVDAVEVYERDHFPDDRVYGPSDRPELRIITCGGPYSRRTGYEGNVVAFAHLTGG